MTSPLQPHILIIKADYYKDIVQLIEDGVVAALNAAGATFEVFSVPGALEAPGALGLAAEAGKIPFGSPRAKFHGCVAIGCVIRGETSHYDIVATESIRGLLNLSRQFSIPLGNGILTVENRDQAMERAHPDKRNKGRDAAQACLAMIELSDRFQND